MKENAEKDGTKLELVAEAPAAAMTASGCGQRPLVVTIAANWRLLEEDFR